MEHCDCLAASQYLVQLPARTQAVAVYSHNFDQVVSSRDMKLLPTFRQR